MAYWLNDMGFCWGSRSKSRQDLTSIDDEFLFVRIESFSKSKHIVYFSNRFREKFKITNALFASYEEAKQYVEQFIKTRGVKIINKDMLIFK